MNGNGNVIAAVNGNGHLLPAQQTSKVKIDPKQELSEFDEVFKILMEECLNEGQVSGDAEIGTAMTHFLKVCKCLIYFI